MLFLFKWVIFRFHLSFPGCTAINEFPRILWGNQFFFRIYGKKNTAKHTHTLTKIWWFEKSTWVSHRLIYFSNTQPTPIPAHWLSQPTTPPGPLTKTLDQILDKDLWSNSRFLSPNTCGFDGGLFLFLFVDMWGCSHVMPCCWSGGYMKWTVRRNKKINS